MTLRSIILLIVALGAATFTALYARGWISAERAAILASLPVSGPKAPPTLVLVAKNNLQAGSFVKESNLKWQPWPDEGVADEYIVKGEKEIKDFVGAVVRNAINAGQPLTGYGVVQAGDRGFLAAVLTPGKRAVSVPLNATSGISGFVFPGDLVDVILTMRTNFRNSNEVNETRFFSETLLWDIRILAVDQEIENANAEGDVAKVAKTATLEVTPKQAEKISLALKMGSLSLSLQSLARESGAVKPRRRSFTMDTEVNFMGRVGGGNKRQVVVLRGGEAQTTAY